MTPYPLKRCPSCKFWWFDRTNYGCTKQQGRVTYTTSQLWKVEDQKIYCADFRSRKAFEYLLQLEGKAPERLIVPSEIEEAVANEKVSKGMRKISIDKKPKKSEYNFTVNKPKRLIRKAE